MHRDVKLVTKTGTYPLSATVDEEASPEPIIYDVTIWRNGQPETFTPEEVTTQLRVEALESIMEIYKVSPVLETVLLETPDE